MNRRFRRGDDAAEQAAPYGPRKPLDDTIGETVGEQQQEPVP
jgi:hypothetical protein